MNRSFKELGGIRIKQYKRMDGQEENLHLGSTI